VYATLLTFCQQFIQGDTKERELLKCVVAAMYSWQHCGTGTLSYKQPCHPVIMEQWNGQQCTFVIKMFDKNNDSLEGAQREFRHFFNLGRHGQVPSKHAIKTWMKNFEETGLALKKKPSGRPSPQCSVRKLAAAVRLFRVCVRPILHVDLKFHPYKLQIVQE